MSVMTASLGSGLGRRTTAALAAVAISGVVGVIVTAVSPYVILAVSAGVIVVPLVVHWPRAGIAFLLVASPLTHGVSVLLGHPEISMWKDFALIALAVGALPGLVLSHRFKTGSTWVTALLVGYAVWILVPRGESSLLAYLFGIKIALLAAALYFLVVNYPFERKHLQRLLDAWFVIAAVVAAFGLVQMLVPPDTLIAWGFVNGQEVRWVSGQLRIFSSFNDPFSFASYLGLSLTMFLMAGSHLRARFGNPSYFGVLVLIGAAFLFTWTRSAWLGLIVALIFLGVWSRGSNRAVAFGGLSLIAVALTVVPSGLAGPIASPTTDRSVVTRLDVWGEAMQQVERVPLGYGVGTVGAAAEKSLTFSGQQAAGRYNPVDSQYVLVLYELGFPGLIIFVALWGSMVFHGLRRVELEGDELVRRFLLGCVTGVVFLAAGGIARSTWEEFPAVLFAWAYLGFVFSRPNPGGMARSEVSG